jgi:hypothetical protein
MRRHFLFILFSLMFACACPFAASAADYGTPWDGAAQAEVTPLLGGAYLVNTAAELAWVAAQDTDYVGWTVVLKANIDLNSKSWKPIGTAAKPFRGTFQGNGHLIRGLGGFTSSDAAGVGLFGHVGAEGVIEELGISGGKIHAKNKSCIGAIAGVCAGQINRCWSMAQIVVSGDVTGGLVGELKASGSITDCYQTGILSNPADYTGGIVGRNAGTLTRVYNAGYTANDGFAIVGDNQNGTYNEVYFDRKVYLQKSGIEGNVINAIDSTALMFELFDSNDTWFNTTNRYPVLAKFKDTDAAILSATPMYPGVDNPVEHANSLTVDFTVSTDGGVSWACQNEGDKQWIQINGSNVKVVRPCAPTNIFVDSKLNNETRVVLMNPLHVKDLIPGTLIGNDTQVDPAETLVQLCFNSTWLINELSIMTEAREGWLGEDGDYTYQVILFEIDDNGNEIPLDTLLKEKGTKDYQNWYDTCHFKTNVAGHYMIRSYVHDNGCYTDWKENLPGIEYTVFHEFIPGRIETKRDTFLLTGTSIIVNSQNSEASTGGVPPYGYQWYVNNQPIADQTELELTGYEITEAGVYKFTRSTYDSKCMTHPDYLDLLGTYTVWVYDAFDPGQIENETDTFCTAALAQAETIYGTQASGAVTENGYRYKWFLNGTEIENSDSKDLALSNITFESGQTYTFTRQADNKSRFTDWTDSQNSKTIYISAALTKGAIEQETRDIYCFDADADASASVQVVVAETEAATCGDGVMYQWIRTPDYAIVSNDKELNIQVTLGEIDLGKTYTYVRQVRNSKTDCGWETSEGAVQVKYGQKKYKEVTTTVCENDLPYTMTLPDGTKIVFHDATETHLVNSAPEGECPDETLYKIEPATTPVFTINDKVIGWCQGSNTMGVGYTDDPAAPANTFLITFSPDLAAIMNKKDTTGPITVPNYIEFVNVPYLPSEKQLYLTLQLGYQSDDAEGVCYSRSSEPIYLYPSIGGYVYSKYDRVVFVDNNPNNGALADSVDNKLEFVEYQWYKNGQLQQGQTGQYYHEDGVILRGVFYCMLTDTKGGTYRTCDVTLPAETTPNNAPQFSTVYPVPVNAGGVITIETFGQAAIYSLSGECITSVEKISGQTTVSAPRITGIYYVQVTTEEGVKEMHKLIVK